MEQIIYVNESGEQMTDWAWKVEHLRVCGWKPLPPKKAPAKKAQASEEVTDANG